MDSTMRETIETSLGTIWVTFLEDGGMRIWWPYGSQVGDFVAETLRGRRDGIRRLVCLRKETRRRLSGSARVVRRVRDRLSQRKGDDGCDADAKTCGRSAIFLRYR